MMRAAKICLIVSVVALVFGLPAMSAADDETPAPHRFGISVIGGYTPLPMLDYGYELRAYRDRVVEYNADDESTLENGVPFGLAVGYYPSNSFLNFGFLMEALYGCYEGQLTGRVKMSDTLRRRYRYDQSLDIFQLNWIMKIYFNEKTVRPFVDLGVGAVRVDAEFDDYSQTSYGASALMGWGLEWRAVERVGVDLSGRLTDHFALTYYHEPGASEQATIEAQYIPFSFLLRAHLYFL